MGVISWFINQLIYPYIPMNIPLNQWPFQEPIDWRYLPYIYKPTTYLGGPILYAPGD